MGTANGKITDLSAEIITYLARLASSDAKSGGLTSAQWTALRFFASANRCSRTLSAFADFHVTTRGTASQTVTSLVEKGLLTRTPSKLDGRSAQIDLSDDGRSLCAKDPHKDLARAIGKLTDGERDCLKAAIVRLMAVVATDRQRPQLGVCGTCSHLKEPIDQAHPAESYFCNRTATLLSDSDRHGICMSYKPDETGH